MQVAAEQDLLRLSTSQQVGADRWRAQGRRDDGHGARFTGLRCVQVQHCRIETVRMLCTVQAAMSHTSFVSVGN